METNQAQPDGNEAHATSDDAQYSVEDLFNIVSSREHIISVYLIGLVVAFVARSIQDPLALTLIQVGIWVPTGFFFWKMAQALKEANSWFAFLAAFIPVLNLIMLIRLYSKGTKTLKGYGIKIGTAWSMRNQIRKLASYQPTEDE